MRGASIALALIFAGCGGRSEPGDASMPHGCGGSTTEPEDAGTDASAAVMIIDGEPIVMADGTGVIVPPGGIVPAGNGCTQDIKVPIGSVLVSVAFAIRPGPHTTFAGFGRPIIQVRRDDGAGSFTDFSESVTDPSVNPSEYDTPHSIAVTPYPIPIDGARHYLYFSQEAGGGQAVDGSVVGSVVTYVPAN